jgi:chaperone LolA
MSRKGILFLLAAVLAGPSLAGEPKKSGKPPAVTKKEAPKAAVATQTPPSLQKPGNEENKLEALAIAGLKDWDARLETLQTRFTQEVDFSDAGIKQQVEGLLSYSKPDLLRIEHIKPARQLVYTDKKELWIYKPEDSQAVRTSWAAWQKSQSSNFSGIMDFGNYSSLIEKNSVRISKDRSAPYYIRMELTPRNNPWLYTLTLALSSTDYFPAEATLAMDKTIIRTRLENAGKNDPLDKAMFRFVPPKGTEVLEFNN